MNWTDCPVVEQVAGKMSGAPVLRSSRVRVEDVIANVAEGAEAIADMFWLPLDDVKDLLSFWETHGSALPIEHFPPAVIRQLGADIDWTGCPGVTSTNPAEPLIGGTNVRPIDLIVHREEGEEWLTHSYGLSKETILSVLRFYDRNKRQLAPVA